MLQRYLDPNRYRIYGIYGIYLLKTCVNAGITCCRNPTTPHPQWTHSLLSCWCIAVAQLFGFTQVGSQSWKPRGLRRQWISMPLPFNLGWMVLPLLGRGGPRYIWEGRPPAKDPAPSHPAYKQYIQPYIQAYTQNKAEAYSQAYSQHKTKQTHNNNAPPKQHPKKQNSKKYITLYNSKYCIR